MGPRLWLAVPAALGASGCAASIYQSNVLGPHGEHLIELACTTPDGCMDLARTTCKRDYDIVTTGYVKTAGGTDLMVIQCLNPEVAQVPPADAQPAK